MTRRSRVPPQGRQAYSPLKKRNSMKTSTQVNSALQDIRRKAVFARLFRLLNPPTATESTDTSVDVSDTSETAPPAVEPVSAPTDFPMDVLVEEDVAMDEPSNHRRTQPDQEAFRLYSRWKELLPTLHTPYLSFLNQSIGHPLFPLTELCTSCQKTSCARTSTTVLCLLWDYFIEKRITYCECQTLPQVLVQRGLFPTAPHSPRMAVSLPLLDFYGALFERSCDAINAIASALATFYERRGFPVLNEKGVPVCDPFRRGIGYAVQWYDCLQVQVNGTLDSLLKRCDEHSDAKEDEVVEHVPRQADRTLQDLCPACFGGDSFGQPLAEGGDIHLATDGNFHHRHLRSAGSSPAFYDPKFFLTKEEVDAVGEHITAARSKKAKRRVPKVPDEAVDACEGSHFAAKGDQQHRASEFDDNGLMSIVCRHDIPLFFANIDTPGEQQKYAVALLKKVLSLLPPQATVTLLYDLGCVLDRSLHLYDILADDILCRVQFATTAMHAWAHQWACQLVYNPRICTALGLTDGEGVERVWSTLIALIGMERHSGRSRRIWLIDRLLRFYSARHRDQLGDWLCRKLNKGVKAQSDLAQKELDRLGVSEVQLRDQWALQKEAQLSVRAHAPMRLKAQFDEILNLQTEIDNVETAIQKAKAALRSQGTRPKHFKNLITSLENTHGILRTQVDDLYAGLEITHEFPELLGIDVRFLRTLLLARDLKINIRRMAVESFFEWERLDQAVGGRHQALGTKIHQAVRKGIAKRKPKLTKALQTYNTYCKTLVTLAPPDCPIPLPKPLPIELGPLRDDPDLMEDIWITPLSPNEAKPLWLVDPDVRRGIRALLKRDRCEEERRRLVKEAENLCQWYGRTLVSVETLLCLPDGQPFYVLLQQRRDHLLHLRYMWSGPLVPRERLDSLAANAPIAAMRLTGTSPSSPPVWIQPTRICTNVELEDGDDLMGQAGGLCTPGDILIVDILTAQEGSLQEEVSVSSPNPFSTPIQYRNDSPIIPSPTPLFPSSTHIHSLLPFASPPSPTPVRPASPLRLTSSPVPSVSPIRSASPASSEILIVTPPRRAHQAIMKVKDISGTFASVLNCGHLRTDTQVLSVLKDYADSFDVTCPSDESVQQHLRTLNIEARDLQRLQSPTQQLNDVCVNMGTLILQRSLADTPEVRSCVVLPSYVITATCLDRLWRVTQPTSYWQRSVWILPLHLEQDHHWAACTIRLGERTVHLFDSFASRHTYAALSQIVYSIVKAMLLNANAHGYRLSVPLETFTVMPVQTHPVQTNPYDCGMWTILYMFSVLRGHDVMANVREEDMPEIRRCILSCIYNLRLD